MNKNVDSKRKRRQLVQLIEAVKLLHQHNVPLNNVRLKLQLSLLEFAADSVEALIPRSGKKPRSWKYRCMLATFAAAVTALKKERGVDDAIVDVAIHHGVTRKELKNFRDRLNRGRADGLSRCIYKINLAHFAERSRAELFAILRRYMYLTSPS